MATVYIHIGAPKTATSTLQHVLASNYRRLLEKGVLYPQDVRQGDAHHVLVCDLIEKHQGIHMPEVWYGGQPRGQAWKNLQNEIARHGGKIESVVLSSELFFGQSKRIKLMLDEIAEHLSGHDIRIIAYLRRQDELYSSFFNQDIKGLRQWPHSAYQFYETHQIFQFDYFRFLKIWSDAFGAPSVMVRPYEPSQWVGGDIVQDFCVQIGVKGLGAGSAEHNESLGPNQLYIKRCLNRVGYEKALNDEVLGLVLRLCREKPVKNTIYVRRNLYRKYRRQWLNVNERLSSEFLQGRALFDQPIPTADQTIPYFVDHDRVFDFLQNMTASLAHEQYSAHRQLFSRAALLMLTEKKLWERLDSSAREQLLKWV